MSEWQPIETAPLQEDVVIYMPHGCKSMPCQTFIAGCWDDEWLQVTDGLSREALSSLLSAKPTHWMPLPEPPEDA